MQIKILLLKTKLLRGLALLAFIFYCNNLSAVIIPVGPGETHTTIQAAVTAASSGDEIVIQAGNYNESVVIPAGKNNLIIRGGTGTAADVTIDGNNTLTDAGIQISNGVTGTTIQDLSIENFVGYTASEAAIYGIGGNNSTTIVNVEIDNIACNAGTNGGGVYFNGPVNTLTFNGVSVTNITAAAGGFPRGIVVWNGLKENISITNCTVSNNGGCCGIELQDGTATGVTITGNNVSNVGDSGMGLTGIQGPGVNIISGNTITDCGRFGMEIKNPNGSGETSGAGSIVVENNSVTFTATGGMNNRDHAGIAVFRRGFLAGNSAGYADVPTGVVVQNNTVVSGYQQLNSAISEGFGIVIEGTNHTVTGNTVSNNDIGIQEQGGGHPNANYVANNSGDGSQNDGDSPNYFGRGNSPVACGNTVSGNIFSGNGIDFRQSGAGLSTTSGVVQNTDTGATFCTIQAAIDDAATDAGDVIEVNEGTFDEQVLVNKEVTINGVGTSQPIVNFTGAPSGKLTLFDVSVDNVTIDNLQFEVDLVNLSSAIIVSNAAIDNITVTDNTINPYGSSGAGSTSFGARNAVSINYAGFRVASSGVDNVVFNNNTVTATPSSDGNSGGADRFFRSGLSLDEGGGTFNGNTIQSISHDILIRFNSNGTLTIQNNNFNGGGLQLSDHNAGGGAVDVSNNIFEGTFGNTYTSTLRLQNNQQTKATNIAGNTFTNHRWAISLENYPSATIDNNTFTPLTGLTDFRHITVNTKSISSNSNSIVQTTIDANIINNIFDGNAATGGIGIGFYDHDSDNSAFGTFTVGSAGNENTFNINLETFILLDNATGSSDVADAFFGYGVGGGWTTTMACWTTDINVEENNFNTQTLATLEDALFHQPDDACTGLLTFSNTSIVQQVPTLSEWGLIILALSLMTLGVLYIIEEKKEPKGTIV